MKSKTRINTPNCDKSRILDRYKPKVQAFKNVLTTTYLDKRKREEVSFKIELS